MTMLAPRAQHLVVAATALSVVSSFSASSPYQCFQTQPVIDPGTGKSASVLEGTNESSKKLVVVLPQLGEFDSSEFCEFLVAAQPKLKENNIDLRVVGIGNTKAAAEFTEFSKLPQDVLRIDPYGKLHEALELNAGPNWDVPDGISDNVLTFALNQLPGGAPKEDAKLRPVARSWLNYLAMCAGLGAPGTLREILRGYLGDKSAPERFRSDDTVKAGFITIGPGVGPVEIGPIKYEQWFSDEKGYQRPVELATVRLKNMVEVLTKWQDYVSNPETIDKRGGTFLLDADGSVLYQYKHRGVLTYSETMARPLSFLAPYIGEEFAMNPLKLPDNGGGQFTRGRGILKPAGKAMSVLSAIFKLENTFQAKVLGATDADIEIAMKQIQDTINNNSVVIYTYSLSPFSSEAVAVLDEIGFTSYKNVEVGLEWFLLDRDQSTLRAALLELTGQSSLPQVFINGKHIGGLFTGNADGSSPGLAGLKESGDILNLLTTVQTKQQQNES